MTKRIKGYLHTYTVELNPTPEQKQTICQTIGVQRFVYNLYITENRRKYKEIQARSRPIRQKNEIIDPQEYISPSNSEVQFRPIKTEAFFTWLMDEYLKDHPDHVWIKEVSESTLFRTIENARKACHYTVHKTGTFPVYKKKKARECSWLFEPEKKGKPIISTENFIQLPGLDRLHLKQKGSLPHTNHDTVIISGKILVKNNTHFVSVTVLYHNLKQILNSPHNQKGQNQMS